jgi:hypothetical protein
VGKAGVEKWTGDSSVTPCKACKIICRPKAS